MYNFILISILMTICCFRISIRLQKLLFLSRLLNGGVGGKSGVKIKQLAFSNDISMKTAG